MGSETGPLVLLVEDNAADVSLIEEVLADEQPAPRLHVVRDGAKALEFIRESGTETHPALVLLDLNLPKVSGEEVLQHLRATPGWEATKVLIISSSNAVRDRERAIALGASGYFRKPFTLEQFMELGPRVREMLGNAA